jgi:inhibitor of cysteine peptidase
MRMRESLAIAAGVLLACSSIKPLALTSSDSGTTIEMVQGQELVLTLESNRTTGYRWWLADSNQIVLLPTERPSYQANPAPPGAVGTGGVETWRFKAAQSGTQTLRFEYKRSFAEQESPAKTLVYTVVVLK